MQFKWVYDCKQSVSIWININECIYFAISVYIVSYILNQLLLYIMQNISQLPADQGKMGELANTQTFACPWKGCGRLFRAQFSLNRHMVLHTDAKKYGCRFCQRKFSLPQYLREHEYTHTKELPYVCGIAGCSMRFRQAGKLSLHRRTHPEYNSKKYDYTLNQEKRTKLRLKCRQTGKSEPGDCGMMFKVTKMKGHEGLLAAEMNDDTKAHGNQSHGVPPEDSHPFALKPLPPIPFFSGLSMHSTAMSEERGHNLNIPEGKPTSLLYVQDLSVGKVMPLLEYLSKQSTEDSRPVLPLPPATNTSGTHWYSTLDLFSLIGKLEK